MDYQKLAMSLGNIARDLIEELVKQDEKLKSLTQYLKDSSNDMECLPKCDSFGHEEDCPVVNTMAAFRKIREENVALKKEVKDLKRSLSILRRNVK